MSFKNVCSIILNFGDGMILIYNVNVNDILRILLIGFFFFFLSIVD